MWGAIKIGHLFTMLVWTIVLIILGKHNDSYIASDVNFMLHQALVSTLIFVFSLTIVIMGYWQNLPVSALTGRCCWG